MPLNGNTLPYVPPAASTDQQIAAINRIIDIINAFQTQIVFSDDTTKRMLIGYQQNGFGGTGKDFGIKVSQAGKDVTSAADADLLFQMDLASWDWYNAGVPQTLVGASPDDGRNGIWVAKPGTNVRSLLGG